MSDSTLLKDFIDGLNANVFLREFTFASTEIRVPGLGDLELADHLVLLDDLALLIQLKERAKGASAGTDELRKWFANKVTKKATKQIRDTIRLLKTQAGIEVPNQRGHRVAIMNSTPAMTFNLVIYRLPERTAGFTPPKFYRSKTAGFIHFMSDVDYFGVCNYLVTPTEIAEYLTFRERVLAKWSQTHVRPSEPSLVGQFFAEEYEAVPGPRFERILGALREDASAWDLSHMLMNFGSRITYVEGGDLGRSYYRIISEFAKLSRADLREFKKRLRLALDAVEQNRETLPYRIVVPRTSCGFVIAPVTREMANYSRQYLQNLSLASKYEQKASRQIGLVVTKTEEYMDIEWLFTELDIPRSPELDEQLARNYPFRRMREHQLPRYLLDSQILEDVIEEP